MGIIVAIIIIIVIITAMSALITTITVSCLGCRQGLQHKLALEANRVVELEGLLSGMRTSQFKSQYSEQHSADKAGTLQARNTLLTEQVCMHCWIGEHTCRQL